MTATPDGFEFFIQMRDEFSGVASKVAQSIEQLSTEIRQLREAQNQLAESSRKSRREAKKQADTAKETAKAKKKDADASKKLSKEEQRHFDALQKIDKAQEEVATQEKVVAESKDISRLATRKKLRVLTQEQQGLLAARAAVRSKLAEDRKTIAVARAEEAASKKKTRQLAIEAEAQQRLARIRRRAAVEARTLALAEQQGIDPRTGRAREAEVPESVRIEQEARRKFEKELQALKIRNQQEIFRRQSEEFQRLKAQQKVARTTPRAPQAAALTAQQRAQIRLNRDIEAAQTRLELERLRKLNPQYQQLQREVGKLNQRKRGLLDTMKNLNNRTNRVSFTFRRLFGILAAFTAARAAIGGFNELVRGSITFNSTLEQAQLGIRSILVAVGGVTDTFGNAVDKVEQFERATAVANDQIQKLRVDAQRTAATFEQLVSTFQVAIAPGITAGLDIDQIREFTIRISQAAGALGVQQNQLVEEIRSVLEGTIQKRTTRIASALGITNQDIERAKELGVLSDFLQDRFQAFALAGEAALGTFSAVLTNTIDAFKLLVGTAGEGYFESIKALLNEIRESAIVISEEGGITPSPQAQAIVQQIFNGLEAVVQQARQLREELTFDQLRAAAQTIGTLISTIGSALLGAVQGILGAFQRLQSIASFIAGLFTDASNLREYNEEIRKFAASTVEILATWLSLSAVFSVVLKGIQGVVGVARILWLVMGSGPAILAAIRAGVAALRAPMAAIAALSAVPQASFLAIVAALIVVVELTRQWYSYLSGADLTVVSTVKNIGQSLIATIDGVVLATKFAFELVEKLGVLAFRSLASFVTSLLLRPIENLLAAVGTFSDAARVAADDLRRVREENEAALEEAGRALSEPFENAANRFDEAVARYNRGVEQIVEENTGTSIAEMLGNAVQDVIGKLELPEVQVQGLDTAVEEVRSLRDVFQQFTGLIGKANADLDVSAEKLKELQDESRQVGIELAQAIGGEAATSQAQRIAKEITQSRIRQADVLFEIENKITNNEKLKAGLLQQNEAIVRKLNLLRQDEQQLVTRLLPLAEQLDQLESQRIQKASQLNVTELGLVKARSEGNKELIDQLSQRQQKEKQSLDSIIAYKAEIEKTLESISVESLAADGGQAVQVFKDLLENIAQSNLALREGEQLAENKKNAEDLINGILNKRLALMREESAFSREQETLAAARAFQIARIETLSEQLGDSELQQVAQGSIRLLQSQEELRALKARSDQNVKILRQLQATAEDSETRLLLEEQILDIQKRQNLEIQASRASVSLAAERLVQAREAYGINNVLEQQQVIQARLEAGAQRLVNLAEESRSRAALTLAERSREVAQTQLQIEFARQEGDLRLQFAERRLQTLRQQRSSNAVIALAERDILVLKQQQSAEQEKLNADLDAAAIKLERARQVLQGTFTEGLQDGLRQWANNLPTEFERGVQVMTGIAQNFSTFLSTLIVDAFDPTQDVDLEQRLGQFFQGVAQIASQSFIEGLFQKLLAEDVTGIGIEAVAPSLVDQATQASQILIDANAQIGSTLANSAPEIASTFADGVNNLANSAANTLGSVVQSAQQAATGLGEAFSGLAGPVGTLAAAGTTFTTTVIPGLDGAAAALLAAAEALALAAKTAAATAPVTAAGGAVGVASGGRIPNRIAARHSGRPRSHASRGVRGFASGGRPSWVPLSDTIPAWLTPGEWVMRLGAVRSYGENVMDAINSGMIDPNALRALAASARGRRVRKPSYPAFAEGGLATSEQYQRSQVATDAAGPSMRTPTPPVLAMDNRLMDQFLASGSSGMLRWMRDNKNSIRAAISDERGTR